MTYRHYQIELSEYGNRSSRYCGLWIRRCFTLQRATIVLMVLLLSSCDKADSESGKIGASGNSATPVSMDSEGEAEKAVIVDVENSLFHPSSQTTPDGKVVPLKEYASTADCVRCHKRIGAEWKGSMHSAGFSDPFFRALYHMASEDTDGKTDRLCMGCHSSPLVLSGHGKNSELDKFEPPVTEGISCVVCHFIDGSTLTSEDDLPANASFVADPKGPIHGPHAERRCLHRGRATVASKQMRSSEFCGNCHRVVHPNNGLVVDRTYEEWLGSIYAEKGIQCQDCHMRPVELAIETARTLKPVKNPGRATEKSPMREHISSHYFVGANTAITKLQGADEHAAMAEELLKSAASLKVIFPEQITLGQTIDFDVRVTNETAGHNLPTSLTEVRQMWLDVEITDTSGKEIFRSGALDKDGKIDPDAVMFHSTGVDAQGNPTIKPWQMVKFLSFHTIPPRDSLLEHYTFAVPKKVDGPLQVRATLRYRSYSQELARLLLGDDTPVVPIIDMVTVVKSLETP